MTTPLTPVSDAGGATPPSPPPVPRKRVAIFRWRGIFALLFAAVVVAGFWILFADRIIKSVITEAATKALGVEVDIRSLHVGLMTATFDIRGFTVADPNDPMRNLIDIGHLHVLLDPKPLLLKKVAIRDITIDSVRGLSRRSKAAKTVASGGFLPGAVREAKKFGAQFNVPLLSLTPIDTIRALVLDPSQLQTVQKARALAARADSVKDGATAKFKSLRLAESADSAQALLSRLKGQTPRSLGITGTRNAVNDVRRFVARVDSTKKTFDVARLALKAEAESLVAGVRAVDSARQADYAFARGLLKLPTFDAPNIGPALFGTVSLDVFEKAMTWVEMGRKYAPPGLLPKEDPGPKRLRRAGTTIHFVKQASIPDFHLRGAALNLVLDSVAGAGRGTYALRITDVTSHPAIVGKPTTVSLTRTSVGAAVESLVVVGVLNHVSPRQTETIVLRAGGLTLPKFTLPGVPLRLDLGKGVTNFRMDVVGDSLTGRWVVNSPHPIWGSDSARQKPLNTLESLVTRVLTGIPTVEVTAEIRGSTKKPTLKVNSNLDRAVADNIKRVAGEEIAKAEAKVRAQVDAFVEKESAPIKAKVDETRAEIDKKIAEGQAKLDQAKADLAAKLKELTAGLIGGP